MTPEKQDKTLELSKHWYVDSTPARNEVIMKVSGQKPPGQKPSRHKPPDKNPLDKNPPCQKPPRQNL